MRTTCDTGAGHGGVHEVLKYVETYGSNTSVISSEEQKKHGRKSSTSPEQELFMVLARTRCGLLLQNLARRYGMWTKNVSRIRTTWLNHLHQQLRDLPIWPTLNGKTQLSLVEETTTRKVASVRVLVEREISRIKIKGLISGGSHYHGQWSWQDMHCMFISDIILGPQ